MCGFGGMRNGRGVLRFAPRLPGALTRVAFRVMCRGRRLMIDVRHAEARYSVLDGEPIEIVHHGQQVTIGAGQPTVLRIPPAPARQAPAQPAGREPLRRRASR
jgi:alpha,alpha-trehalose phosphorylase